MHAPRLHFALVLALLFAALGVHAQVQNFRTHLSGAEEVPPNASAAQGQATLNGPVVAWLYPSAPPAQLLDGRSDGVLSAGVITAGNLVGPLAGQPLQALIDLMASGDTYVNVHTSQFPPGEVRGQIR
jgi:hypothetical protein